MSTGQRREWSDTAPITFVESVLLRPRMYTLHGSIAEVVAFLEGFASGMAAHTRDRRRLAQARQWWDFCDWLRAHVPGGDAGALLAPFLVLEREIGDPQALSEHLLWLFARFWEGREA